MKVRENQDLFRFLKLAVKDDVCKAMELVWLQRSSWLYLFGGLYLKNVKVIIKYVFVGVSLNFIWVYQIISDLNYVITEVDMAIYESVQTWLQSSDQIFVVNHFFENYFSLLQIENFEFVLFILIVPFLLNWFGEENQLLLVVI